MKNKYKKQYYLLSVISWGLYLIGFIVLLATRGNIWFKTIEDGLRVSIGFILALVCFLIIVFKKSAILKGSFGIFMSFAIVMCLKSIVNELWLILLVLLVCSLIQSCLKQPLEKAKKRYELCEDTVIQEEVKKEYSGRV